MSEWHELIRRIEDELALLEGELSGVKPLFDKLRDSDPDFVEMRAAALSIHSFYNGCENVFALVAKHFDKRVPSGLKWHRQLLDQMCEATEYRPAIISQQEYDMLAEYLTFRHLVRHSYPGSLSWYRFSEIARDLYSAHRLIERRIRAFLSFLNGGTEQ